MATSVDAVNYPPAEFSRKYGDVLAPKGKLVSPKDVFGEKGCFDKAVEERTRKAFAITVKKLEKIIVPSQFNKEALVNQEIDQIVECFPQAVPKELPALLAKCKWKTPAKEVENWDQWWGMHEKITKALTKNAKHIHNWWEFTGKDSPGEAAILESLKRLSSSVLTHPVTIGKMVALHTPKKKKNYPKSVHLVGTDKPEATMIYGGFFQQILAANPDNPIKLTLVSPDPANVQLSKDCSPESPMLIDPRCKLTAWGGFYHDFWDDYIEKQMVEQPHLVMGIHPGLHADGIFEYWEPTLELLLDKGIKTVFTVLDKKEYSATLERLDCLFAKYLYKGLNPFASKHIKQAPHDPALIWSSNMYMIVFKGRTVDLKTLTLIEEPSASGNTETDLDTAEAEFEKLLRESGE